MQGPDAHARQHGKGGLGNHGHVDQNPVALLHAQALQGGGHALHFCVQFCVAVAALSVCFGGDGNQCWLVRPGFQVPVYRVVAQVGGAAHKPLGKRRVAVVADLLGRGVPFNERRLLAPEGIAVVDGVAVKVSVAGHWFVSFISRSGPKAQGARRSRRPTPEKAHALLAQSFEFIIIHNVLAAN